MTDILCCYCGCGQKMERDRIHDVWLHKSGTLVTAYSCPACGYTDQVVGVIMEAPVDEVISRFKKAMVYVEGKGKVIFEQVNDSTWSVIETAAGEK